MAAFTTNMAGPDAVAKLNTLWGFNNLYLGSKNANPTLDNDGNALVAGAIYYNTVVPELRIYTGTVWTTAYQTGGSFVSFNGAETVNNKTFENSTLGLTTPLAAKVTTFTASGQASLGGVQGAEALRALVVASSVNALSVSGSTTGNFVTIGAVGSDANVGIQMIAKGFSGISFSRNRDATTATQFNFLNVGGLVADGGGGAFWRGIHLSPPVWTVSGANQFPRFAMTFEYDALADPTVKNFYVALGNTAQVHHLVISNNGAANSTIFFASRTSNGAANSFEVLPGAAHVNWMRATGGTTGNAAVLEAQGETNVQVMVASKGTSPIQFRTNSSAGQTQFIVSHTASAVNYTQVTGAATNLPPVLSAQGTDTNVGMSFSGKGKGNFGVNTTAPGARFQVNGEGPGNVVATVSSVDTTADTVTTSVAHGLATGDMALVNYGAGTQIGGLAPLSVWFVNAPTTTTLSFHATLADAMVAASKLDLTSALGTATTTLLGAYRVHSVKTGSLGSANNGLNLDTITFRTAAGTDWTTATMRLQYRVDNTPMAYIDFNPSGNSNGMKFGSPNASFFSFVSSGGEQFRVVHTASVVNYGTITGSATAADPVFGVDGTDANINVVFQAKGTGSLKFATGGGKQFQINNTASAVNFVVASGAATGAGPGFTATGTDTDVSFTYVTKGAGAHAFYTNSGVKQFQITHTASAVNYVVASGSATGSPPAIFVGGTDTDISFNLSSKGAGSINFITNNFGSTQFQVAHVASAVNYLIAKGSTTGTAVSLTATGSDTDITINMVPKGAGFFQINGVPVLTTTGVQTVSGKTLANNLLKGAREVTTISATAATGTINFDALTQGVLYYTTNASAVFTLNVRGDGTNTLNSIMNTGESMTVVFMNTNGATPFLISALNIDGSAQTIKWQGGSAPSSANASAIDAYSFTIIKTGNAAFTALGSLTKFA